MGMKQVELWRLTLRADVLELLLRDGDNGVRNLWRSGDGEVVEVAQLANHKQCLLQRIYQHLQLLRNGIPRWLR